jgi:hypothetical protein
VSQPSRKTAAGANPLRAGLVIDAGPVIDADFVAVGPQRNFVPKRQKPLESTQSANEGMDLFRRGVAQATADAAVEKEDRTAFYGFSVLLVALSFWFSGGYTLFARSLPATATIQSTMHDGGAMLAETAWRVDGQPGREILRVEGIVRNPAAHAIHSETVAVQVRRIDGSKVVYRLGEKGWALGAGQEVTFTAALDIAAADVASVAFDLAARRNP